MVGNPLSAPPSPDITDASWISALPILRTIGFFFFFPEDRCVNSIGISKNKGSGDAEPAGCPQGDRAEMSHRLEPMLLSGIAFH